MARAAVTRRLPVYLLLDCSGSMAGEPIAALEVGVRSLVEDLTGNPYALETVWLSVIAFSSTADLLVPLTALAEFRTPSLEAWGSTALGAALDLLLARLAIEVRRGPVGRGGDWRPLAFLFTDGSPTDDWEGPVERFRREDRATLIACGAGPAVNTTTLAQLGGQVVQLRDTRPGTLGRYMKWVSDTVVAGGESPGGAAPVQRPGLQERLHG